MKAPHEPDIDCHSILLGNIVPRSLFFSCFLLCLVATAMSGPSVMAQPDVRLSDMRETFWRLATIDGVAEAHDNAVVRITDGTVDFSSPCFYASYPFHDDLGRFGVSPPWNSAEKCAGHSQSLSGGIESELKRTRRFELSGATLTFLDDQHQPLISLVRLQ